MIYDYFPGDGLKSILPNYNRLGIIMTFKGEEAEDAHQPVKF
jgi:hypothetical protein